MRDGSLSAPPETKGWPLLAGYRLEVDEGQGEAWWPLEPSAGPST